VQGPAVLQLVILALLVTAIIWVAAARRYRALNPPETRAEREKE
jgi:hypothetical protein